MIFWAKEWESITEIVHGERDTQQQAFVQRVLADLDSAYLRKDFQKWITAKKRLETICRKK